jgi:hypothetical protein
MEKGLYKALSLQLAAPRIAGFCELEGIKVDFGLSKDHTHAHE